MPDLRVERTVSASAAEFRRGLEAAFPNTVTDRQDAWQAAFGPVELTVAYRVLPAKRIALLALPQLAVELAFSGGDAAGQQAMLERLDRYTHRGGG